MRSGVKNAREPWVARLFIPNYRVKEAARYAGVSAQTIANWHASDGSQLFAKREDRASLSYMQLIEIAVVAAFRKAGVRLKEIRSARAYLQKQIESEYPFAEYKFKSDGKALLMDYAQIEAKDASGKLIELNKHGQLAWSEVLNRLKEFEYDSKRKFVSQWHLADPIVIDPRISFGAPTVSGTPTWAIRDRWFAKEAVDEIADDFDLSQKQVIAALKFEGIKAGRHGAWVH